MRVLHKALVVLTFALAACGDSYKAPSTPGDPGGNPGGGGGGSTTNQINVVDNLFQPAATTVPVGTTVTWTWQNAGTPHNVTFATGQNSVSQQTGTFERTFGVAGTFSYSCTLHPPGMTGSITVQ